MNHQKKAKTRFDLKILDYINKIKEIDLSHNSIVNKVEIVNFCKQLNINLILELILTFY